MKKVLFCVVALLFAITVSAQTDAEMQASKERTAKLEKLMQPKDCGCANIDALTSAAGKIATESIQITPLLQSYYFHSKGQTEAGVADASVKMPKLADLQALGLRIKNQVTATTAVSKLLPAAGEDLAAIRNPLKLKAPTKSIKYAKDVLTIVGEESVAQGKAVAALIKTVTAKK
ncbi:MAG: hypothetical protein RR330_03640 [Alistipes sp.]